MSEIPLKSDRADDGMSVFRQQQFQPLDLRAMEARLYEKMVLDDRAFQQAWTVWLCCTDEKGMDRDVALLAAIQTYVDQVPQDATALLAALRQARAALQELAHEAEHIPHGTPCPVCECVERAAAVLAGVRDENAAAAG